MSYVLSLSGITKSYGRVQALKGVSFDVPEGSVFGILGPNGSGKTTLLSIILDVLKANSGNFLWFGQPGSPAQRSKIGSLLETPNFYHYLSAIGNLKVTQSISGRGTKEDIDPVLKKVKLYERRRSRFKTYSLGMKQRLGIAEVLVKNPKAIILDEPTLGIDPDGAIRILELIKSLNREHGLTVMLSSHQLQQVQEICSRVGIIVKGKLIVQGQMDDLGKSILKGRQWNFLLEVSGNTDGLERDLQSIPGVDEIEPRSHGWFLRCTQDVRGEVVSLVIRKGVRLLQLRSEDPTLEEIYLKYFREA